MSITMEPLAFTFQGLGTGVFQKRATTAKLNGMPMLTGTLAIADSSERPVGTIVFSETGVTLQQEGKPEQPITSLLGSSPMAFYDKDAAIDGVLTAATYTALLTQEKESGADDDMALEIRKSIGGLGVRRNYYGSILTEVNRSAER